MDKNFTQNEVHFKIGIDSIEFDAKGDPEFIERERNVFETRLLPLGVDAMVRTKSSKQPTTILATTDYKALPEESILQEKEVTKSETDWDRTNLTTFVLQKGAVAHKDFILCAVYYDEKKNNVFDFSSETVKQHYSTARKKESSNTSEYLKKLVQKGLIIDSPEFQNETPKKYRISSSGIKYVEQLTPKEGKDNKTTKPRKPRVKVESAYSGLNIDELNLQNYPEVKSLKDFKEKMMMVLFILTAENKGEWFTVGDILYLMSDVFGEHVTRDMINGVFKREKLWFKAENIDGNKKEMKRKLLNKGFDYAKALL